MKICGPKLSVCGLIISVWGIIQLDWFCLYFIGSLCRSLSYLFCQFSLLCYIIVAANLSADFSKLNKVLMGLFYHMQSLALLEDVKGLDEPGISPEQLYNLADIGYSANAMNCWIAACLYIVTLLFSGHQFYINSRNTLTM